MEVVETQEVVRLQESRNEALAHLFELKENPRDFPSSSLRWDIPLETRGIPGKTEMVVTPDTVERLKEYITAELDFKGAQVKAARPGFDTKAESDQLMFTNALNFLESGGKYGGVGMERALKRLYRVQSLREYKYHQDGKSARWERESYEIMREWMHILSCQVLVARTIYTLLGEKENKSLGYSYKSWEGYSEDKIEIETLKSSLERAYSNLPVDWNLLAVNEPRRT